MRMRYLIAIAALLMVGAATDVRGTTPILKAAQTDFEIAYLDVRSNRVTNFATVTAGTPFDVRVVSGPSGRYRAVVDDKMLDELSAGKWRWIAPSKPDHYRLAIVGPGQAELTVNIAVEVPAAKIRNGRLNGYRIGNYPARPLRGLSIYNRPEGFIEVMPEHLVLQVSPRFQLAQFLCRQESNFPKYLLLRPRLLLKLEYLLDRLNEAGYPISNFHVMSGYRTPAYNAHIGNGRYSRHTWGGAADIFVDQNPRDGVMDDLNNDGHIDKADAHWLAKFIESLAEREDYKPFIGGLSPYGSTASHGPFVHIDVRGSHARW